MAKFAIACPVCGKYAEAKTGFFAKKKIECSCGNIINVKVDKLASKQCPHCGNQIVFEKTLPTLIQTNETYESTQIDAFFESKPKIDAFLKIDANAQRQEYKMAS